MEKQEKPKYRKRISVSQNYNLFKFVEENKEAIENGSITPTKISEKFGIHPNSVSRVYKVFGIVPPRVAKALKYSALPNSIEILKLQIHVLAIAILELSTDCGSKPHPGILKMVKEREI